MILKVAYPTRLLLYEMVENIKPFRKSLKELFPADHDYLYPFSKGLVSQAIL